MTLADQKIIIGVTANEVLSMEQEAEALDSRAAQLRDEAQKTRNLLSELLTELKDQLPDNQLPTLFTTSGILFDTTASPQYLNLRRVTELHQLLELPDQPAS